jgi:hypothetical protein
MARGNDKSELALSERNGCSYQIWSGGEMGEKTLTHRIPEPPTLDPCPLPGSARHPTGSTEPR